MLQAALLWYKKLRKDLEEIGYVFNSYDPCVANKMINGKQMTVRFHVDDMMMSHVDSRVNDNFLKWLNSKYGEIGEVTCTRGAAHDYLGMTFKFVGREVQVDMREYVVEMLREFPVKFTDNGKVTTPAGI